MSFAAKVWNDLSAINVNEKVEKKQSLSYLSWAWAWGILMEHFPESTYVMNDPVKLENGTVEVSVTLTVREGEQSIERFMWLPVMDHRNKAIQHPDSWEINKAKMRCLTKAMGMAGLGHYIYAGEDLPEDEKPPQQPAPQQPQEPIRTVSLLQAAAIRKAIQQIDGFTEQDWLEMAKIQRVEDFAAQRYEGAIEWLKQQAEQQGGSQ